MDIAAILVPIVVAILLGWFFKRKTDQMLLATFRLVTLLPGGLDAKRAYDDMKNTKQVRGVSQITEDGKSRVAWKFPPYKDKLPKP